MLAKLEAGIRGLRDPKRRTGRALGTAWLNLRSLEKALARHGDDEQRHQRFRRLERELDRLDPDRVPPSDTELHRWITEQSTPPDETED